MTTISAKELRENLSDILQRGAAGEGFEVIYRSKPVLKIVPLRSKKMRHTGEENAKKLAKLIPKLRKHPIFSDPTMTYKKLRDEIMLNDPKYRRYVSQR